MVVMPPQVKAALKRLEDAGYEAYIVGGCVRDGLMGHIPDDYDITTSAFPEEVARVFAENRVIETGIKHGTLTVIVDNMPLEITTFRVDGEYTDSRHPSSVSFTRSLKEDVMRRDFTMNAIACGRDGSIIDYYDGAEDIECGVIRCVGDAEKRFCEDALRIMRALRFSSVLGFEIEEQTRRAAFANKERLANVSAERIYVELIKLLCGKNVRRILMEYIDILGVVVPELLPMKGFCQQNSYHIYDVLEHTAAAVESIAPEPVLRLAALFHDCGKPASFTMDEDGTGHFYGHSQISAQKADEALLRLKTDTATRRTVTELVNCHDIELTADRKCVKRRMCKLGEEMFFLMLEHKRADCIAQNPSLRSRLEEYDEIERIAKKIIEERECFSVSSLAVNGSDLIEAGVEKGKMIGDILSELLDEVIAERVKNEKSELLELVAQKLNKNENAD